LLRIKKATSAIAGIVMNRHQYHLSSVINAFLSVIAVSSINKTIILPPAETSRGFRDIIIYFKGLTKQKRNTISPCLKKRKVRPG
jgi:hypothetical protein